MNKKTIILSLAAVFTAVLLVAVSSNSSDTSSNETARSFGDTAAQQQHLSSAVKKDKVDATDKQEVNVEINDFYFDATILTIKKGTKVTWTNQGKIRHDVRPSNSSPASFDGSELLGSGEDYSYTFDEVGEYFYFCSPHPTQMRGIIIVTE